MTNLLPHGSFAIQSTLGTLGWLGSGHLEYPPKQLRLVHVVNGLLRILRVLELHIGKPPMGFRSIGLVILRYRYIQYLSEGNKSVVDVSGRDDGGQPAHINGGFPA